MKKTKRMNAITGILLLIYAFIQSYLYIVSMKLAESEVGALILSGELETLLLRVMENPSATELQPLLHLGYVTLFSTAFAIALFILGIVTLVLNLKDQGRGKINGIIAACLCIGGFIIGWLSIFNIIFVVMNAVIYFISFYYYEKDQDHYRIDSSNYTEQL